MEDRGHTSPTRPPGGAASGPQTGSPTRPRNPGASSRMTQVPFCEWSQHRLDGDDPLRSQAVLLKSAPLYGCEIHSCGACGGRETKPVTLAASATTSNTYSLRTARQWAGKDRNVAQTNKGIPHELFNKIGRRAEIDDPADFRYAWTCVYPSLPRHVGPAAPNRKQVHAVA